ncbi:hypothetical protein HYALB_00012073 [Hymenoscyphus albidus]|uniref:NACHT domain-containing protein n=1 Tax=Hymenoscyphus albidus TaxID=595503 RepID=A0A9N9LTA8_9HELO|nr:hypothetical protein HYALB_00012073 [Hymenoscyphus albidus]
MWMYYAVEHDLGYKGDQNSKELDRALEILKGATNLTTEAFEQFEEVLGKQKLLEGQTRVASSFVQSTNLSSEERVASQIQNLLDPENQELLSKLLQAHATNAVRVSQIASIVPILHDSLKKNERQALFSWLSKMQPKQNHKTIGKDFMTGSGKWLLEKPSFNEWREGKKSSILWLHGIPGSGKTKLVYSVIERFSNGNENDLAAGTLAFFYCTRNASEPERADPDEIMRSILKQLCCTKVVTPVREPLVSKYKELKEESDDDGVEEPPKPTCDECVDLIISLLESIPATIILDALDECDPDRRHELLLACDKIIQRSVNVVRIFVSSRDDGDIVCRLEKSPNVYIKTEDNHKDIKRFVLSEVGQSIAEKRLQAGIITEGLRKRIVDTLVEKSQGMFRWVSLQIQNLCDSQRIKHEIDVVEELGKLPRTLKESYEITYQRIQEAPTTSCRVAKLAMTWQLCAHTPLNTQEFITAVSVDTNATDPTGLYITLSPSQLFNMCRNLIVLDEETDMFRFAHLSVQEYLQERKDFATFTRGYRCKLQGDDYRTPLSIAIQSWDSEIIVLLLQKQNIDASLKEFGAEISLVIACEKEESKIVALLVQFEGIDVNARAGRGGTPLLIACQSENLEIITSLLQVKSIDINARDKRGRTSLFIACEKGTVKAVSLLLQFNVIDINAEDGRGRTPLSLACENENLEIITLLLQAKSIDVNAGRPLSIACDHGNQEIIKLLLRQKNIDINSSDSAGPVGTGTPLEIACKYGNMELVTLLLESKDIDVNAGIPLYAASQNGNLEIVTLLLQAKDVNINGKGLAKIPLASACEQNNLEIVKLLLENKDIDINARDHKDRTPLIIACEVGNLEIVTMLLQNTEVDVNAVPQVWARQQFDAVWVSPTSTALVTACGSGNMEIIQLLLRHKDIKVNTGDLTGDTVLLKAARMGNLEIATARTMLRKMRYT